MDDHDDSIDDKFDALQRDPCCHWGDDVGERQEQHPPSLRRDSRCSKQNDVVVVVVILCAFPRRW